METIAKNQYKKSVVGMIPEDWNIFTLNELSKYINDGTHHTPNYFEQGIPFYSVENVSANDFENVKYISLSEHERLIKRCKPEKGDLLMTRIGTLGLTKLVDWDINGSIYVSLALIKLNDTVLSEYLYSYTKSEFFLNSVLSRSLLNATPRKINMGEISQIPVPVPPTFQEQKAIAAALSDMDNLITSLDNLINKKKAIKQGAIQRLMTPKESWATKTIKELARYRRGSFPQPYGLPKWYDDISGMPFVQVVDVDNNNRLKAETKQKISSEGAKKSVFVKKGTILLTIQGSIGRICITQYDAYVDRTLLIFESFLEDFNKYFFMLSIWLKFQIEKENAPGGIIKTITKEALSSFEISYPDRKEQDRIASILSDMDSEIERLEEKKGKCQGIKEGMMQELLTGKTRLI